VRPLSGPATRIHYTQLLRGQDLLALEAIWHWQPGEMSSGSSTDRAVDQAEALIAFLAQRYGSDSVIRFLRTLGTADSLPLAIERTLVVNYRLCRRVGRVDRQTKLSRQGTQRRRCTRRDSATSIRPPAASSKPSEAGLAPETGKKTGGRLGS
jgi:hypothetical protein